MTAIEISVAAFAATLAPGARVIDVGCGLQPYRTHFSKADYFGIDVEASGRQHGQKTVDAFFDGTHIPADDASVDAILCTEVLEHAVDPCALVAEMFRVLKPGGVVCITVPFMWGLHELPYDFRRFTPNGLAKLVTDAGLMVDSQQQLTQGAAAIRMLINSELNNYRVNVRGKKGLAEGWRFRLTLWVHERLLRVLDRLWQGDIRFERIYIDNLLHAHKPGHAS